jgi:hypothetical protein
MPSYRASSDASYNNLQQLASITFASNTNLLLLYLHDNIIAELEPAAFFSTTALQKLSEPEDLRAPVLPLAPVHAHSLLSLYPSYLANNEIGNIPDDAFRHLTALSHL